jgi:GPH family glycoside/pentoside/hexuronide:cation symporter
MEKTTEQNTKNENRPVKLPKGYLPAWSTRTVSLGVYAVLFMQLTFYATESLGMDVALVGALFLGARIFDGFTDVIVGFVIDSTHTRFGKARPYELLIIPLWIFVIMLFSAQAEWSTAAKAVYITVLYILITGICQTCLNNAEGVLLRRSLTEGVLHARVLAGSGVVVMLFGAAANIMLPRLMQTWGREPGGWSKIALAYGIPMMLVGIVRFFFIKETAVTADTEKEKFGLVEGAKITITNKYVILLAVGVLLVNIIYNMSSMVGSYYFNYVIGNLGLMSVMGLIGLATPFFLLLFPVALRKIGGMQFVRIGLIIATIGNIMKLFAPRNLPVLIAGNLLAGLGSTVLTMMIGFFVIQCMDHVEWKSGKRLEGMAGVLAGVAGKIGSGIAPALVGAILSVSGYIAGAATQSESVHSSIIGLYTWIPAVFCLVTLFVMAFYDLDKKIHQIRVDLQAGRTAADSVQ